jgi:hypothetical protein
MGQSGVDQTAHSFGPVAAGTVSVSVNLSKIGERVGLDYILAVSRI